MPALLMLGRNVLAKMRGNTCFPEPTVPLDELEVLLDRFNSLISLACYGSKHALMQRNACADELRSVLTAQAYYVRMVGNGNAVILSSSGFTLRKIPQLIGVLPAAQHIYARSGRAKGRIDLRWTPVKGAKMYEVFMAAHGSNDWQLIASIGRASFSAEGLTTDSRYWFKVRALGTAGMGPESGTATSIAA